MTEESVLEAAKKAALIREARASVALDTPRGTSGETQSGVTIEPNDSRSDNPDRWRQRAIREVLEKHFQDVATCCEDDYQQLYDEYGELLLDVLNLAEEHHKIVQFKAEIERLEGIIQDMEARKT